MTEPNDSATSGSRQVETMKEETLRKLRLLPVIAAVLLFGALWWWISSPDQTQLVFTTGSKSGMYHRLASQLKAVIEAEHPDISIELKMSAGSRENIERIDSGQAQLALVQNDAIGGKFVRSMAAIYPEMLHLISRTNIQSLPDLTGKRVSIGAKGSGTEQIVTNLLQFANSLQNINPVQSSFSSSLDQLETGELDAAFILTGLGTPSISEALADKNLHLASIRANTDLEAPPNNQARMFADGFQVHYPHIQPGTIPLMAYRHQPTSPTPTLSVQAVLVCHEDVPLDVVERITRTLFEQRAALSQHETTFKHLDEGEAITDLQFPLHDGADYFYRRQEPGFLVTYAEPMAFVMSVALLLWSMFGWIRKWYDQKRKNRIDTYYQAVEDVIRRLHDGTDLQEIDELEAELLKIRQRASAELVAEQLAADESFIIYQNMLNGCQAMLVRMRERIKESPDGGKSANLTP